MTSACVFCSVAYLVAHRCVVSGPKRYDYDTASGKWFYARDNHTIDEVLNIELSDILGIDVKLLD